MSHLPGIHRPPVPTRLAGWRPAAELAASIEAAGLAEATRDRSASWGPSAERLVEAMDSSKTYPRELSPTEWRLTSWSVAERERGRRSAEVSVGLSGRAFDIQGVAETVRVYVWARRRLTV